MKGFVLTKHFEERWFERVGNHPTPAAVRSFIAHSIKVQSCEDVVRSDGSEFRILAIFWHPELDLMIKVDEIANRAVTVLSRECWGRRRNDGGEVMTRCETVENVPSERIERVRWIFRPSVFVRGISGVAHAG